MFSFKIKGLKKFRRNIALIPGRIKKEIARGIREAAFITEAEAKKALTVGRTRAIDTGRLRADTVVRELSPFRATIYPTVNYAIFIHEGTRSMRARPFMKVAIDKAAPQIEKIFGKRIKTAFKII